MVILFTEQSFALFSSEVDFNSDSILAVMMNAGLFGVANGMASLRSMEIISDVVGLSTALSCTHRRAT